MKILRTPNWRLTASIFLSLLVFFYTQGCSYFKVKTVGVNELPKVAQIGKIYNYFILHQGDVESELDSISIEEGLVKGILVQSLKVPVHYTKERPYRYKPSKERNILHEVHFYLKDGSTQLQEGKVSIPVDDINEIRVVDKDTGKTVASYFFSTVGIIAGALTVALIIWAATKSSCPYIYANDGEAFVFEGETYSGAIFKGLERDDYMPLPNLKVDDSLYKIRIADELKERQFTNLAKLIVVNHPRGSKMLLDKAGMPHLITKPQPALLALSEAGIDLRSQMATVDRDVFLFNEKTDGNHLYLSFEKPKQLQNGKLVLNLKNTLWGDFVYGEFSKKFGSAYTHWIEKQNQLSKAEIQSKSDRNDFKLVVSIKTQHGWEVVAKLPPVGPLGNRDVVVPIDLGQAQNDKVEVRLTSSFMFWEVDYAAMDFSSNDGIETVELSPAVAFGSNTPDARTALSYDDDKYLEQSEVGEVTEVHFKAPAVKQGMAQSFFLHTKGYYNHIRDYKGLPDREELEKFKTPGSFDQFSKDLYKEMMVDENELLTMKK